jgi:hypothetical protein
MRVSVAFATLLLVSFATLSDIRGGPLVGGLYANRLGETDIAQIKALVSKEPGIDHRLKKIEAVRPDKVAIQTGGKTAVDSATYYDCNAYRRAGRWTIDTSSIEISIETIVLPNNGQILTR